MPGNLACEYKKAVLAYSKGLCQSSILSWPWQGQMPGAEHQSSGCVCWYTLCFLQLSPAQGLQGAGLSNPSGLVSVICSFFFLFLSLLIITEGCVLS